MMAQPTGCNLHEVVGEHGRRDPQLEALATFGGTTLHTATAEQHRDASLDAGAKALAALELLLGNAEQFAIWRRLLILTLPCGHPLKLLHPAPRRSRPISETPDTSASQRRGELTDQARDDANDIP